MPVSESSWGTRGSSIELKLLAELERDTRMHLLPWKQTSITIETEASPWRLRAMRCTEISSARKKTQYQSSDKWPMSTHMGLSSVDSGLLSGLSGGLHVLYEEEYV